MRAYKGGSAYPPSRALIGRTIERGSDATTHRRGIGPGECSVLEVRQSLPEPAVLAYPFLNLLR